MDLDDNNKTIKFIFPSFVSTTAITRLKVLRLNLVKYVNSFTATRAVSNELSGQKLEPPCTA